MRRFAAAAVLTLFLSLNFCFALDAPSPAPAVNSDPKKPLTAPATAPTPSAAAPKRSLTPLIAPIIAPVISAPLAQTPVFSPVISAIVPAAGPKAGSSPAQSPRPLTPWGRIPAASPVTVPSLSPMAATTPGAGESSMVPTAGPVQSPYSSSPPSPTTANPSEDVAPAPHSSAAALNAAVIFSGLAVIAAALVI